MFLLRARRPGRYGKWVERMPAPDPEEFDQDEAAGKLEAELDKIAERAPERDGNAADEWAWPPHGPDPHAPDSRTRVEE